MARSRDPCHPRSPPLHPLQPAAAMLCLIYLISPTLLFARQQQLSPPSQRRREPGKARLHSSSIALNRRLAGAASKGGQAGPVSSGTEGRPALTRRRCGGGAGRRGGRACSLLSAGSARASSAHCCPSATVPLLLCRRLAAKPSAMGAESEPLRFSLCTWNLRGRCWRFLLGFPTPDG